MAEDKKLPLVELVAVERGFYKGRMVEPGQSFQYDPNPSKPGNKVKPPSWAKEAARAKVELAEKAAKVKAFDTKPKEAAAAVQKKASQLASGL